MNRRPTQIFLQRQNNRWPIGACKDVQHHYLFVKCKSKLQRSYHTPVRTAIIKEYTNNKCWTGYGEDGTLLNCSWEHRLVWPPTVRRLFRKVKRELHMIHMIAGSI